MAPETLPPDPSLAPGRRRPLESEFDGFGDRAGQFVRSLLILAEGRGDLANYASEPNLRIVRSAFGKWSVDILVLLAPRRRLGFGELKRALPGVSSRVLSGKLKRLEDAGIVVRSVVPDRPPRPEYALTERAQGLVRASGRVLEFVHASSRSSRPPGPVVPPAPGGPGPSGPAP